jgi:hypothetical protein
MPHLKVLCGGLGRDLISQFDFFVSLELLGMSRLLTFPTDLSEALLENLEIRFWNFLGWIPLETPYAGLRGFGPPWWSAGVFMLLLPREKKSGLPVSILLFFERMFSNVLSISLFSPLY